MIEKHMKINTNQKTVKRSYSNSINNYLSPQHSTG